jgi:GNAT superfamily N-acetyltransferase
MDDLRILPLTPDLTVDFLTLFGPSGACYGCWCQHFRLRPKDRERLPPDARRHLMVARIADGPPPGLLAYQGGDPVGWMQIGPRADVPEWNNRGRASSPLPDAPADDPAVWAMSCLFFRSRARGKGLSHAMLAAGIAHARASGARLLEASPMDRARQSKSVGLFVGSTSVFVKAGFHEVARAKPGRPLMRLAL